MTNYVSLYFAFFIEGFIAFIYFYENYNTKHKLLPTIFAAPAIYSLAFLMSYLTHSNVIVNLSSFIIVTLIYGLLFFEMPIRSGLFHTAILTILMAGTELITELLSSIYFKTFMFVSEPDVLTYFILAVISKVLYFIVVYLVAKVAAYRKNNALGSLKSSYLTLLYPITISLFILFFCYISSNYNFSTKTKTALLVLTIISILISVYIVIYNQRIQKRENELADFEKQQMKSMIDMQYLDLLEKKNQQMQILTHDYKNHLAAIRELGDNEQVAEYIDKMTDEIKSSNSTSHSGNHTLDIIINKYVTECELKHISFDFDTKLSNIGFVDDFDLVTILGNVLDNALEAAEKSKGRKITLSTKIVNTYDTIIITNSCDAVPDKNLKTEKPKGTHGLGLKSVEKTIKNYGGDFEWEYDENSKEFIITIMIKKPS